MPIANIALTAEQFNILQANITQQVAQVFSADDIALSGLNYVCDLQENAPEVDLVGPYNDQLSRMDGLQNLSNWVAVVVATNNHIVTRSSIALAVVGSVSDKLNAYLTANSISVTGTYAELSAQGGFIIEPGLVDPVVITSPNTASGTVGVVFNYKIVATQNPTLFGALPISPAYLPPGLSFDTVDGVLSGVPTTPGISTVTITATNPNGTASEILTITIS